MSTHYNYGIRVLANCADKIAKLSNVDNKPDAVYRACWAGVRNADKSDDHKRIAQMATIALREPSLFKLIVSEME